MAHAAPVAGDESGDSLALKSAVGLSATQQKGQDRNAADKAGPVFIEADHLSGVAGERRRAFAQQRCADQSRQLGIPPSR